jgi:hypothetical protein
MKVNRFAMSQKIFCKMFVQWFNAQLHIAQALRYHNSKDEALSTLKAAEELAEKTFIGGEEPFEMREYRETLARLRLEINRELSDLREASVHSS